MKIAGFNDFFYVKSIFAYILHKSFLLLCLNHTIKHVKHLKTLNVIVEQEKMDTDTNTPN